MEIQEDAIDLLELLHIIRKRLWVIVLITVMAVAVSGVLSFFFLDKIYETSTTLMVSKAQNENVNVLQYNDVLLNQKLVKTYSEIAKSDRVLDKVIDKLELEATAEDLRKKVAVNSVQDTEIIRISVEDPDPQYATDLANAIAVVFMGEVADIMKMDNVQLIDPAKVPDEPVKPRPVLNMAIAGLLGLMVSLGVIFLIEYLDNTVKTPQDIENRIGLPVLGSIPDFE